jgi:hypothetical protein
MLDRHLRRALAVPLLAAALSLLTASGVHAAPRRAPSSGWRAQTLQRFLSPANPLLGWLSKIWAEAGMRIDDNG